MTEAILKILIKVLTKNKRLILNQLSRTLNSKKEK